MNDFLPHSQKSAGQANVISLRDIVYIIFRRRWVILMIWIPIIFIASLGLFKNTGSYVASCQLLVDLQAPEVPRWNTKTYTDVDRTLSTYMNMAMSVPVVTLAAEMLQDSLEVITSIDNGLYAGLRDSDELAGFLLDHLDVSPKGESSILELNIGTQNPRFSLMAIRACRDAFLEYSISAKKNTRALEYYDDQVTLVRNEINVLLTKRNELMSEVGYFSVQDDIKLDSAQLAELRDKKFQKVEEMSYLQSQAQLFRQAREENPDFFPSSDTRRSTIVLTGMKDKLEEHRSTLMALQSKYTDDHVDIVRAKQIVKSAEEALSRELDAFIQSFEIDAETARVSADVLQSQMDELREAMFKVPDIDRQVSLINSEVNAKNSLLGDLQLKRGEVQLTQQADDRINMMVKLTEPDIERVISGSRKFAYFFVLSLMGLMLALVIAFVLNFQDHRFHSTDSMENQLGVPVLGAISQVSNKQGAS
jgi:uncharacterized protein involved in exopolysaccharide biosynthesis